MAETQGQVKEEPVDAHAANQSRGTKRSAASLEASDNDAEGQDLTGTEERQSAEAGSLALTIKKLQKALDTGNAKSRYQYLRRKDQIPLREAAKKHHDEERAQVEERHRNELEIMEQRHTEELAPIETEISRWESAVRETGKQQSKIYAALQDAMAAMEVQTEQERQLLLEQVRKMDAADIAKMRDAMRQ